MTRGSLVSKKQDALRNKLHNKRRGVSADGKGAVEVQYINIKTSTPTPTSTSTFSINVDNTMDSARSHTLLFMLLLSSASHLRQQ